MKTYYVATMALDGTNWKLSFTEHLAHSDKIHVFRFREIATLTPKITRGGALEVRITETNGREYCYVIGNSIQNINAMGALRTKWIKYKQSSRPCGQSFADLMREVSV